MMCIKIELEKGRPSSAKLMKAGAPKTRNRIAESIPFSWSFHQAIVALPPNLTVEPES